MTVSRTAKKVCVPFFAAALCLTAPCAGARLDTQTPRRLDNGARLDWVRCWFEPPFAEDAACAHFVPSAPAGAAGPVRLPVVVLRTALAEAHDSPVLYLPPGPGPGVGLTARGLEPWWQWQQIARWPHDLVLYDARGAGLAQPRLDCPEMIAADRAGLGRPLTADEDLRTLQQTARACHARLRAAGVEPAQFSTAVHVRDAGELTALLGGNDWNLWGVSYGTRLALHAVREFPQRVRSLILDSAYPPEVNGLLAKPGQFARMLDTLDAVCARDADCARQHPALPREIAALMAQLAEKPALLEVEKWPGLWRHPLAVNDYRLLWMLFLESYRPSWRPRYPRAIAAARAGDYAPLLPLAEQFIEALLDPDYSHGTHYSATCPEDLAGVTREAYLAEAARHPSVAAHFLPEWDRNACHAWDAGKLPQAWRKPVRSKVPALFLSGGDDVVTPPQWAARAARGFARGRHYTVPGASHGVTWSDDCATGLAWEFLANPRAPAVPACWGERDAAAGAGRGAKTGSRLEAGGKVD